MGKRVAYVTTFLMVTVAGPAAQHAMKPSAKSPEAQIKLALSAAPADIARGAAVVDAQMKQLRAGTNGWVCMAEPEVMCLDKEWQGWADAWINKKDPQIKSIGIAYMLKGDKGASNTDPYATGPTPDNQWVATPSHVMLLTPNVEDLQGLPTDPYNGGPFVMWKGTKYAHIMIPLEPMPKKGAAAKPAPHHP